ncbi:MAG: hypothetical protein AAB482_03245, partial [Patescibacteria group bacterium]
AGVREDCSAIFEGDADATEKVVSEYVEGHRNRRQGDRPAEFEHDGVRYRWWANISEGSFFLYVIERFARYGTYKIQLRTPADHKNPRGDPGSTSVYVATDDWNEPHAVLTSLKAWASSQPKKVAYRLYTPDSEAARAIEAEMEQRNKSRQG